MRSGLLRHRITIQTQSVSRNSAGEEIITWQDVKTVWAEVRQTRAAREGYLSRSDQVQAKSDFQVIMRYSTEIEPHVKQRIVWRSKLLDIQNVVPDRTNRQWTIFCEAII